MMPAASSRRTRSSDARGDSPTVCASFWMVERPSRCRAARILTSMRSSAGGRLAAMDALNQLGLIWSRWLSSPRKRGPIVPRIPASGILGSRLRGNDVGENGLVQRFVLDRHGVVEREPAAVGIDGLAGDVAGVRRREEDRDRRDLVGLADASE